MEGSGTCCSAVSFGSDGGGSDCVPVELRIVRHAGLKVGACGSIVYCRVEMMQLQNIDMNKEFWIAGST